MNKLIASSLLATFLSITPPVCQAYQHQDSIKQLLKDNPNWQLERNVVFEKLIVGSLGVYMTMPEIDDLM